MTEKMDIQWRDIGSIKPYERNAKKHPEEQVQHIANSLKRFGWKQPLVVDKDGVVVVGHGRLLAAKKLGLKSVPCVCADDLTEAEIKAFRLADNKTNESAWDDELLDLELDELAELDDIDMSDYGFETEDWFSTRERNDTSREEGNEEYNEFLDKFEPKRTTDDCYTPNIVYDAVADWVAKEYGVDRKDFVRPFFPGGDYQAMKYKPSDIVVDNPPFSILSEILSFYKEHNVKFFLFAPSLTLFSSSSACALPCGVEITYENGACVDTSFLTNMEDYRVRVIPELYNVVDAANTENISQGKRVIPKYKYPKEVLTAAMCNYMCAHGVPLTIRKEESYHTRQLDSQKEAEGQTIFGSGYLLSEKAAAEKAAAEKAAAEKAAAEKAAAEKAAATVWELSEREKAIIKRLGTHETEE